ncbi:RNA polymerase sigma factor [candidate division KSB1 bacterium]|nr:RNA polymerase sigma factor [candidate division KSB1 bacterium]
MKAEDATINTITNRENWVKFVSEQQSRIYNVCFRLTGNRADAEDVAQDVLVKAIQNLNSFQANSQLTTWLYRIAVNESLNFIKRRKRLQWLTLDFENSTLDPLPLQPASEQEQPDYLLERKELELALQQAIQQLPEKQKTAFVLHKLEGLAHQEIAEILQISVANVEARIHRAKLTLQKQLIRFWSP